MQLNKDKKLSFVKIYQPMLKILAITTALVYPFYMGFAITVGISSSPPFSKSTGKIVNLEGDKLTTRILFFNSFLK